MFQVESLSLSPGRQARKSADGLEGVPLHGQLQRGAQTFTVAQHLHVHGELVLEMLPDSKQQKRS